MTTIAITVTWREIIQLQFYAIIMETIPLDILLNIIDLLAGGDDEDVKSLRILSQACKFMVPLCRKHFFSSIRLFSESNSERFSNLLSQNPDIARYVRSLYYAFFYIPISGHELNIIAILKERSPLQSILLTSGRLLDWNDFPESIRSSLVSLIQLPTVTFLSIYSFKGFPVTALSGCGSLINLQLGELKFGRADHLKFASLNLGGPIVDLSSLQKAEFDVKSRDDLDQVYELIKVTTKLEYFILHTCISGE